MTLLSCNKLLNITWEYSRLIQEDKHRKLLCSIPLLPLHCTSTVTCILALEEWSQRHGLWWKYQNLQDICWILGTVPVYPAQSQSCGCVRMPYLEHNYAKISTQYEHKWKGLGFDLNVQILPSQVAPGQKSLQNEGICIRENKARAVNFNWNMHYVWQLYEHYTMM